jgi:hypothetical protein
MQCPRCGGLMVQESFMDMLDTLDFLGSRCLICGEIVDAGIVENRRRTRSWSERTSERQRTPPVPV